MGIDIGTTTSKGVIVTADGEEVAACSLEHGVSRPHPGWAEHDADDVWWGDFVRVCRTLLQQSPVEPKHITAVGCSTLGPALLPLDQSGQPLRPGMLYGIDTRAAEEIEMLKSSLGEGYDKKVFGRPLSSQAILPKILWIKRHEPEVFRKTAKFVSAGGYIIFKLTNNYVIDQGNFSGGGYPYDIQARKWDERACGEVGIGVEQLPELSFGNAVAGRVTEAAAAETNLAPGTPVSNGTGDVLAELFSLGVFKIGRADIRYGTNFGLGACTDKVVNHPRLMTSRLPMNEDIFLVGGGQAAGAGLTKWFRDNFGQPEMELERRTGVNAYDSLNNAAGTVKPGSEGLVLLPYFNGERCPFSDPNARGMFFGLTLRHKREHIYRAIFEGVAYALRHILDALGEAGITITQASMVGGATKNSVWTQIVSDVTQVEQRLLKGVGSPYGAAYLAGLAAGAMDYSVVDRRWDNCDVVVTPNPENKEIYDKYYQIYRRLYEKTADEMHLL